MASLLLSVGVPMISGGDEMGRTQQGNNNAYCQDNEISWTQLESVARAAAVPRIHPPARAFSTLPAGADAAQVFPGTLHPRRRRQGHLLARSERPGDDRRGVERAVRAIARRADGRRRAGRGGRARTSCSGDTLLILLNAHHEAVPFALPSIGPKTAWVRVLDTIAPHVEERRYPGGDQVSRCRGARWRSLRPELRAARRAPRDRRRARLTPEAPLEAVTSTGASRMAGGRIGDARLLGDRPATVSASSIEHLQPADRWRPLSDQADASAKR